MRLIGSEPRSDCLATIGPDRLRTSDRTPPLQGAIASSVCLHFIGTAREVQELPLGNHQVSSSRTPQSARNA
jgi:hypothetical protein